MTDNEIIKALECRVKSNCPKCPYFQSYPCDKCKKLDKDTLDLINRLQEKNSNLTSDLTSLQNDLTSAKAEVERLKKEKDEYAYLYEKHINTAFSHIKAEAYKEFAEKTEERIAVKILKDKSNEYAEGFVDALDGVNGEIDNLLKELVGEDK